MNFLAAKTRREAALHRLFAVAPPIAEAEIQAEVDAVRAERRARSGGADRS